MITKQINCMVVDDDEVDRLTVLAFMEHYPFIHVMGDYESSSKALTEAKKSPPDVLFLDIDMPGMNGLELREELMQIPACIFITSYPDYAVEGFELSALDFLVKPFSNERFAKTMERLKAFIEIRLKAELLTHTLGADTIFIKEGTNQIKLNLHEVLYLEALNNYTTIVTTKRKHTVLSSLGSILKEKAFQEFIRIHRSFAVQKHFIRKIKADEVEVHNIFLPIGRSYKEALKDLG
ncbi:MAG: response regulator transcription factor [Bacteroidetes bacterium]|nr:response regulator transcription factor [Bacteroidota bacterium]